MMSLKVINHNLLVGGCCCHKQNGGYKEFGKERGVMEG